MLCHVHDAISTTASTVDSSLDNLPTPSTLHKPLSTVNMPRLKDTVKNIFCKNKKQIAEEAMLSHFLRAHLIPGSAPRWNKGGHWSILETHLMRVQLMGMIHSVLYVKTGAVCDQILASPGLKALSIIPTGILAMYVTNLQVQIQASHTKHS
jgi:hypothetical protein